MDFEEYTKKQKRTSPDNSSIIMVALGLTGESGEFADIVKKHLFQGHPLDTEHLVEELGDILWYISEGAKILGVSLSEVAQKNIEKLEKRYPEGFDPGRSINRKP